MKIRPLHEIDLARIAPLPQDQQRKQLEQLRNGRPPFSYNPLRGCLHDIFNVEPELFGPVKATEWSIVESELRRKCKTEDELKANLAVAHGLHNFATAANMRGRAQEFFPLSMGPGQKVSFWLSMVLALDGIPLVPFIDPRRSHRLTEVARRFVFSMMHERIRAADPDFESVRFAVFQFGEVIEGQRTPILHTDEDLILFSLAEMEAMVSATYMLWREICAERDLETRRKGTGTSGPLI